MPGAVLTTLSTVMCPHGGQAILTTANTACSVDNGSALLETDVHTVAGCPFTLPGPKYSPCIRIQWSAGSAAAGCNGTPVLVASSIGQCYSAEGVVQGVAIIVNTQARVNG
ncbi:MAG: hypothetical protein JST22_09790 [Bacteroidetes bacterium]|nr:hypothetical protein [Bacteroidota bacterium]